MEEPSECRVRQFELVTLVVRSARVHFVVALSSWARLKAQSRLVLDGTLQWKRSLLFFSTITPLSSEAHVQWGFSMD